ncbi:MAG: acyl-[acyl-carrier-protein] thioesterase [Bacteroidales bacterium]
MQLKKSSAGVHHYPVYSNQVNAQKELPVSMLVQHLIDAASRDAEKWGFGFRHLISNNHAWVLARLAFEIERYPMVDDTLTIETWVEGVNKHFTSRNFRLLDQNLNVLGYGRSVWSVIDFQTRESVDLSIYEDIGKRIQDLPCPIEKPGRISPIKSEEARIYRVEVSDLDINRHMTSSRYIDHLLDLFTLEKFDQNRIARFEVQYLSEALYNENLHLFKEKTKENEYVLEMRNDAGISMCKCKCFFVDSL